MAQSSAEGTSTTLLARLRSGEADQEAWSEFVRRYGRQIYRWCRKWKLQRADAQDVTQAVLARLSRRMRGFRYDRTRSFRAYLKTVTHYAWCDFLANRRRGGVGSGDSEVLDALQAVAARDDLVEHLEAEFDRELLDMAMERVQQRVEAHTWEAFRLTALERLPAAEAAERLQLKIATIFKAKSKVRKMLQEEVQKLNATL